jgi:hypothetical protein
MDGKSIRLPQGPEYHITIWLLAKRQRDEDWASLARTKEWEPLTLSESQPGSLTLSLSSSVPPANPLSHAPSQLCHSFYFIRGHFFLTYVSPSSPPEVKVTKWFRHEKEQISGSAFAEAPGSQTLQLECQHWEAIGHPEISTLQLHVSGWAHGDFRRSF